MSILVARKTATDFARTLRIVATRPMSSAIINVDQNSGLLDEKLHISVDNLTPNTEVTLHLNATNNLNLNYDSFTTFTASENGTLNLDVNKPSDNSYSKLIDSMGIFRKLKARKGFQERCWSKDVTLPQKCQLDVYQGCFNSLEDIKQTPPIAKKAFARRHLLEGIRRVPITESKVKGTMFLPPEGQDPMPGLITIHGGINRGSVVEDNAALLASNGFATMALAYFAVDGLPKSIFELPTMHMEYFEEAVDLFLGRDEVKGDGVGLWGISKGGELVLSMAALLGNKIKAVVGVNTILKLPIIGMSHHTVEKIPVGVTIEDLTGRMPLPEDEHIISITGWETEPMFEIDDKIIKFADFDTKFLFVAGDDDLLCQTYRHLDVAKKYMESKGKLDNYDEIKCPGMGHFVDVPHAPPVTIDKHMLFPKPYLLKYGGDDYEMHSKGQEDVWTKMLEFYRKHL